MQPDYSIDLVSPKELLVNGRRLDLENLFRMVSHEPSRGTEIVEHYLEQLFTGDTVQMMTMTLEESYLGRKGGVRDFLVNRALRIYPLYWLAIAGAAAALYGLPKLSLHGELSLPDEMWEWIGNIAIFGPIEDDTGKHWRFLSVGWSLHVELLFYLLIPLLLLYRRLHTAWVAGSMMMLVYYLVVPVSFKFRYFDIVGTFPAFAAGSALYVWRDMWRTVPHWLGAFAIALALVLMCFPVDLIAKPMGWGFYLPMLANVLVIAYLSRVRLQGRWATWDGWCGALSYPAFLFHLPMGEAMRLVVPDSIPTYTPLYFIWCCSATLLVAALAHVAVEMPLDRFRKKIRLNGLG
jgi:peptidoglycan/LPS O-acetylase OafA/YrhL